LKNAQVEQEQSAVSPFSPEEKQKKKEEKMMQMMTEFDPSVGRSKQLFSFILKCFL
jgi:hypothetical protein